ncbi:unnamed protein product [Candida verbasci]|uniref:Oxidation resistance protein 1 n=1 Tax=Candida verbasci TaxID=1227364 RepID=A0A9W4TZF3_9ASCO|nr:unnamed protein product [Candida verbasci]
MSFLFRRSTDDNRQQQPTQEDEKDDNIEKDTELVESTEKPIKLKKKSTTFLKSIIGSQSNSRNNSTSSLASNKSSSTTSSSNNLPPLSPLILHGYTSSTRHKLLDLELASNIRDLLPARLQLFDQWELIYSFEQHGISLNTLYRNSNPEYQIQQLKKRKRREKGYAESVVKNMVVGTTKEHYHGIEPKKPIGYVLIIKDEKNFKFGAFLNENLKLMDHKRYYGNGECFLWKCEKFDPRKLKHGSENENDIDGKLHTRFKAFMYTGINDNIIYSNHDFISIGSSNGQNGLFIDKSLDEGVSYKCNTFGNEILNSDDQNLKFGKFKIMGLEIWRIGNIE